MDARAGISWAIIAVEYILVTVRSIHRDPQTQRALWRPAGGRRSVPTARFQGERTERKAQSLSVVDQSISQYSININPQYQISISISYSNSSIQLE